MALPFVTNLPGPYNVYIPAFQGKQTANLITSYARDPKKFAVNKLLQRTPTELLSGNWMQMRPEAIARIFTDPNSVVWVDGQPRPKGTHNAQDFRAVPYQCIRRALTDYVGWETREQAVFPIQDVKLGALAHLMMTQRSQVFYTMALNTANYASSHVKTATQWSAIGGTGGFWSAGTPQNPIIKRSLANMANQIRLDTMDTVSYKNLTLVISPPAAIAMANSEEIHYYLARSPYALAQIRGDKESQNGEWGLPDKLYDMDLVVDGTLRTTSPRMQVPGTTLDIMDDNTALVMATPGALSANIGQVTSAFSSFHMFVYRGEEMVVETQDWPWDKKTDLSVHETYGMAVVAPETVALATNLFA